ncbi:MAG: glucose-1-phosphate adenylyltransferase [Myxococcota bacterium]
MRDTVAVILGGGKGTRLFPLTRDRSKPAVPLAGKYRLIDIPISNCIHSGIRRMYVLTMYQSASLNAHIANSYRFDQFSRGFVDILAAEQSTRGGTWFQGTADAVRQAWHHITDRPSEHLLILAGDHLYRMNYSDFQKVHMDARADLTLAVQPVTREEAPELGLLKVDATGRVVAFAEKPKTPEAIEAMVVDTTAFGLSAEEAKRRPLLASMGIYLARTESMRELLALDPRQTDFGNHVIPAAIHTRHVQAFGFSGYWADIGTIGAFYEANLDLVEPEPKFDFFDSKMPIYTHARFLPAARVLQASIEECLISDGCVIEGATVRDSILGVRSRVHRGTLLDRTYVMGADSFSREPIDGVPVGIGEDCEIRRAIIDKNARIGRGVRLINAAGLDVYDDPAGRFFVRDGVLCVPKGAVVPDGTDF